jgi:hypothetical protein
MHVSNESRKRKTNFSWPLTLIMQKRDHFRLLRHHYSESPVIPLSNDIWYRCVAHGFITFYFLIFYRWSIIQSLEIVKQFPKYYVTEKYNCVPNECNSRNVTCALSLILIFFLCKNEKLYIWLVICDNVWENCATRPLFKFSE